jgi:putative transposase
VDLNHEELSVARQCALLGVPRSTFYYAPVGESVENLSLMAEIDRTYTEFPYYGSPRMTAHLRRQEYAVNHKRVERLMRLMGLQAVGPSRFTSRPDKTHRIYPYLLRDLKVERPNQVWCSDITYVGLRGGFVYLTAILDWYSRYVLAWELSNTLDADFCVSTLFRALRLGRPEIFNTDQGRQFTSAAFTGCLEKHGVRISMDGRGRCFDNIFIERLWRTVKYEEIYLKDYADVPETYRELGRYFQRYNHERLHQHLGYRTPAEVHFAALGEQVA